MASTFPFERRQKPRENRGGALIWTLVALGGCALVAGAGWFIADGPNRYRASQELRSGRVALLESDLPKALGHLRNAAIFRPTDDAIIQQYDQTQARWVDVVKQRASEVDVAAAYQGLAVLAATEPNLVEPHLGRLREITASLKKLVEKTLESHLAEVAHHSRSSAFDRALDALQKADAYRDLSAEAGKQIDDIRNEVLTDALKNADDLSHDARFDEARAALRSVQAIGAGQDVYQNKFSAIDESEVREHLTQAAALIEKEDLRSAHAALVRAAAIKAIPAEVEVAKAKFLESANNILVGRVADALLANNLSTLKQNLELGTELAGWPVVAAEALMKPASLPDFIITLDTLKLGPSAQQGYINRSDIPLIASRRSAFPESEIQGYLRNAFVEWSRTAVKQRALGFALVLDNEAITYGAPVDSAWRLEVIDQIKLSMPMTVAVADAEPTNTAHAKLNQEATTALRNSLRAKLSVWPRFVDFDAQNPATIVLSGTYAGLVKNARDPERTTKSVRYQSGTRKVENHRIAEIHNEFIDIRQRRDYQIQAIADKQSFIDRVNGNPQASAFERSQVVDRSIEIASTRMLVAQMADQMAALRDEANRLPPYFDEPVYSNERYEIHKLAYTCTLRWRIDASFAGSTEKVTAAIAQASTEFRTEEVVGNANRGVPVRAPEPIPEQKIFNELVQPVIRNAENNAELFAKIPTLTLRAAEVSSKHDDNPFAGTDRILGLIFVWESLGNAPSVKQDYIHYARQLLQLTK